jgi:thioredoxin reductase (NADPH)
MSDQVRDVIIVGSGPAGLTAAIYTARANLRPLVIEGQPSSTSDQPGGQLMLTTDVENYPGFVDGIMGPDLMGRFRAQAERFGAQFLTSKVTRCDFSSRPFRVWAPDPSTGEEQEFAGHAVIVSTGARSLGLGLESERRLMGYGVSTCATCDGFFFRGRDIAVVGGGDSALEEATFLTKFADTVTLIHRRKELRASKIMQDRAFKNPKIRFLWDTVVVDVTGTTKVESLKLRNVVTEEETDLPVAGLFVAIGHVPNTDLFAGQLDRDENGYLITHDGSKTNIEGVFACGDVQDHVYRQAITASGSGCMAAIDAERWLEAQGEAPVAINETPTEW